MKTKLQFFLIGLAGLAWTVEAEQFGILPVNNVWGFETNCLDGSGNFAFTNAISPGEPQRFYLLQVP